MNKVNITKIFILILVIGGFIGITYIIAKVFAKKCPDGHFYDKTNKRCRPTCDTTQYYDSDTNTCLECKPGTTMGPNGICVKNCKDINKYFTPCGSKCLDSRIETCTDGSICDNHRVNYKNQCCKEDEINGYIKTKLFIGKYSISDETTITELVQTIQNLINDGLVSKVIIGSQLKDFSDYLNRNNIKTTLELKNNKNIWKTFKLNSEFINMLRDGLQLKRCVNCDTVLCNGKCCQPNFTCVDGICCDPINIKDGKCCTTKYAKKDGCCSEGEILDSTGNYCMTPCPGVSEGCRVGPSGDNPITVCDSITIYPKGSKTPVTKGICRQSTGACDWGTDIVYTPKDLGQGLPVCAKKGEEISGPFAYCSVGNIDLYEKSVKVNVLKGKKCTIDDCYNKLREKGIESVNMTFTGPTVTIGSQQAGEGICTGKFNCGDSPGTGDNCGDYNCPIKGRCCGDSGLICPGEEFCSNGKCIKNKYTTAVWKNPEPCCPMSGQAGCTNTPSTCGQMAETYPYDILKKSKGYTSKNVITNLSYMANKNGLSGISNIEHVNVESLSIDKFNIRSNNINYYGVTCEDNNCYHSNSIQKVFDKPGPLALEKIDLYIFCKIVGMKLYFSDPSGKLPSIIKNIGNVFDDSDCKTSGCDGSCKKVTLEGPKSDNIRWYVNNINFNVGDHCIDGCWYWGLINALDATFVGVYIST